MNILVIDVGGTNVKFKLWKAREKLSFDTGKNLTPRRMVKLVLKMTADWEYDVVSVGFPGPVIQGKPAINPPILGKGWVGFNFERQFGKPVKVMNDAAMQALGSYEGGRMLFVGLGTGVGSTLILDDVIVPLELGELSYSKKRTVAEVLGKEGLMELGEKTWEKAVHQVVKRLVAAFRTESLVLGGGNVRRLKRLPRGARRGSNDRAFVGGARLWGGGPVRAKARKHTWVIT